MKIYDVLIIGAGPSGSIASAILHKENLDILCIEKDNFPRFVIGESLLPNCMTYLQEAGFLEAVESSGYQYKNGAAFSYKNKYTYFDFCDKSTNGFGTTFQVKRADFDKLLVDEAIKQGVNVRFNTAVIDVEFKQDYVDVLLNNNEKIRTKFIIDASGYGRVLPRLLNLEIKSELSAKKAYFTHIVDNINEPLYDRNKILITTHPDNKQVWFWLIPFIDGTCSVGVVGEDRFLDLNLNDKDILIKHVYDTPMLSRLLKNAKWTKDVKTICEYSKNVSSLYGDRFILLGNAGEFLDPVFSSGVTIALHSACLGAKLVAKSLKGKSVDFKKEYQDELMIGINAFRTYVNGWYDGVFQDIIYSVDKNHTIKRKISAILAGYAWDKTNPYVTKSKQALESIYEYIK